MRLRISAGFWMALALGQAPALRAQDPTGHLIGSVRDSSGVAVPLAQITSAGLRTVSDSAGYFSLAQLPVGKVAVSVRRLGFEPADIIVSLVGGRRDSLGVVLVALPVDLPGVETNASSMYRLRLADFHRHRETGQGRYLERSEIVAMRVLTLSDVLRRFPGVRIESDRSGRTMLRLGRNSGRNCPPDFWIDGIRAPFLGVDDIPLTDIEAIELYYGPGTLPPEYNNRFANPGCGVVVIWTRLPG